MSGGQRTAGGFCALLLGLGCAHAVARTAPATALPPGCDTPITGTWTHEGNPSYQYTATDDGKLARLIPRRVNPDGTPRIDPPGQGLEMSVTLERRITGFAGEFRVLETKDDGQQCGALFSARLTACAPDRLVLQVEQTYAMNAACQRLDFGENDMVEHVLIRVKP